MARIKAIRQIGPDAIELLLNEMVGVWLYEEKVGRRFNVALVHNGGYKVARRFRKALESALKQDGRAPVIKEQNASSRRVQFEVRLKGKKGNLMTALFDSVAKRNAFSTLEQTGALGDSIFLELGTSPKK